MVVDDNVVKFSLVCNCFVSFGIFLIDSFVCEDGVFYCYMFNIIVKESYSVVVDVMMELSEDSLCFVCVRRERVI